MGGTVPGPEPVAAKCFHRTLSGTSAKNRQYRGIKRQPDWSQRKSPATGEKQGRQVRGRNNCRVSTWNTIRLGHFREGILTGKLDGARIQNGRQKAEQPEQKHKALQETRTSWTGDCPKWTRIGIVKT